MTDFSTLLAIAPNFKRRLSGVTTTIAHLVPRMQSLGFSIKALGPGLPENVLRIRFSDLCKLRKKPLGATARVFHARRNTEMLFGIILKHLCHFPLKLIFTSASQKHLGTYKCWLLSYMDAVVATSQKTADFLPVAYRVIHHGVDTNRFQPSSDKFTLKKELGLNPNAYYIGCFGRIRPLKGTDLYIEACIKALKEKPTWQALVIGRTTKKNQAFLDQLVKQIQDAGLSERIHFIQECQNIEQYYQVLDIYVAPQRYEGFGLTPLEALASGVPVIATDVGAYREVITPHCGCIVRTEHDDIAKMLVTYMTDDTMRSAHSKAARAHAREALDLNHEALGLIQLYQELITST